jgi:uncharacterized protein YcfJ
MPLKFRIFVGIATALLAMQVSAQVTFYEGEGFHGRALTVDSTIPNFAPIGFNDRASSIVIEHGRWEMCEDSNFRGRCVVLRPGNYPSLVPLNMNNRISSVRPVSGGAHYHNEIPPPPPVAVYEYRQRPNEPLFEVPVASVRAVVGPPEQRCWIERQQVVEPRSQPNVPGALLGAVIGGVLGHQVGGGRGQDIATAGGAVAGAAIGANAGRGGGGTYTQDVQRCSTVPSSAQPDFWDVTYNFRGIEHRAQMTAPPGPTIWVNEAGEPRG